VKVQDVLDYISSLTGHLGADEVISFGQADQEVSGMLVCWMASLDAIEAAVHAKANLIVAHEALFFPYSAAPQEAVSGYLSWATNGRRAELLGRNGMAVIRAHGTLDQVCVFDEFARLLGLPPPAIDEPGLVKIYDIPETTYGELIENVKARTGMRSVRATPGDPARRVTRIGLPWGGLGLFVNVGYVQKLIDHGCQVLIAGESDNYGMHFAIDAGLDMIETSHEVSENPGMRRFSEMLGVQFPDVQVSFYENPMPWRWA